MYQPPGMLHMCQHHLVKKQGRITSLHHTSTTQVTLHSTSAKIKALEAKLKMMEAESVDHQSSSTQHASSVIHRTHKYSTPYHRPQHINR